MDQEAIHPEIKTELELPKYQWWFDALTANDSVCVKDTLSKSTKQRRDELVNNKFTWTKRICNTLHGIDTSDSCLFQVTTPFSLAVAHAANENVLELMDHGVDVTVLDENGNNCIHVLVTAAFVQPETECKLQTTFSHLRQNISPMMLKELLMQENDAGFRPLELAANLTTFGLFYDIFETKGVYKTLHFHNGIYCLDLYDITDYECPFQGKRQLKSPIRLLTHLDQGSLNQHYIDKVFRSEHMRNWFNWKLRKNFLSIAAVLVSKVFLILSYILFDVQFASREDKINRAQNQTKSNTSNKIYCLEETYDSIFTNPNLWFIGSYIILICILVIFSNIVLFFSVHFENKRFRYLQNSFLYQRNKKAVVNCVLFNALHAIVHVGILMDVLLKLLQLQLAIQVNVFLGSFLQCASLIGFGITTLRYLHFIPGFGEFTLTLEKSAQVCLGQFWIIYLIIVTPYALFFMRLTNLGQHECHENFQSFFGSVYSLFLLTFNMIDFSETRVSKEQQVALFLTHSVFMMFVAVLFVNYLIASFSYYLSEVLEKRHIVRYLQTTYNVCQFEQKFRLVNRFVLLNCQKKCFITDNAGRMYVSKVSVLEPKA